MLLLFYYSFNSSICFLDFRLLFIIKAYFNIGQGRPKVMLIKQTKFNQNVVGSSFSDIIINTNVETLIKVFGKPTKIGSGDNKTQLEWEFIDNNDNNIVVTIYDYKAEYPLHKIEVWHIGSKNIDNAKIISFLKNKGISEFDIKEI